MLQGHSVETMEIWLDNLGLVILLEPQLPHLKIGANGPTA